LRITFGDRDLDGHDLDLELLKFVLVGVISLD